MGDTRTICDTINQASENLRAIADDERVSGKISQRWASEAVADKVTCSPIPDPRVMRVFEPGKGKEILDEFIWQEASFAGADHRISA